ncbi:hypothetical protein BpHYR1_007478 [Brachionus plicatilis]|uniref:Uncharacterized protein n=1 Tax=Brachionus plicatilis TaxID=10195 RepID=A0A3M7Q6R2_BRAPC|nr:hypothetical protein BpHYR1_007478 [Brachionus plicatilis]
MWASISTYGSRVVERRRFLSTTCETKTRVSSNDASLSSDGSELLAARVEIVDLIFSANILI